MGIYNTAQIPARLQFNLYDFLHHNWFFTFSYIEKKKGFYLTFTILQRNLRKENGSEDYLAT